MVSAGMPQLATPQLGLGWRSFEPRGVGDAV